VSDPIQRRVHTAVSAALDKKATDLDVLAVGELTSIADYFVICSSGSERQAQAIADAVQDKVRSEDSAKPLLVEGTTPGRWILLDYGDFIFHVFTEDCRRFYGLERLWGDAPNVTSDFTEEAESPLRVSSGQARNARRKKTS
jgi:ribosome-associated protein